MIAQAMTPPMIESSIAFELQSVPHNIVGFENNPCKKVKELNIAAADAVVDSMTIGLKGRAGAGRTLIAKMVNNDKDVQEKYFVVLWITIELDLSIPDVYKAMGKFLNNSSAFERDHTHKSLEDQCNYLMEAFKLRNAKVFSWLWKSSTMHFGERRTQGTGVLHLFG